jgi:sulfotransferase
MTKTYHFMAGLPRSGSSVLSALLNQHPDLYASPQTDLLELLYILETKIPSLQSFKAELLFSSYNNVIKSLPDNFYAPIQKPVVIDKNRGWGTPYNWENLSPYLSNNGKVIITMRPILEVLASFIKVGQNTELETGQTVYHNPDLWLSSYRSNIDAQVDNLMIPNGEIDRAIFSIANLLKNYGDRIFVVWFDELLDNPQRTLNGIYDFLDLPRCVNDFANICQVDNHNDLRGYGLVGLHDVQKQLAKPQTKVQDYLSDYVITKYKNALDFLWV